MLLVVFITICLVVQSDAYTLADQQIIGANVQSLNGKWVANSPDEAIKMTGNVPGDIVTDLFMSGHIPEPNAEMNFITFGYMWAERTWFYNTSFELSQSDITNLQSGKEDILLVFDSIKMGANIYINNVLVDTSISQFLRLNYSLQAFVQQNSVLVVGTNQLSVEFSPAIKTQGLFSACSGGWDWAPYTQLYTSDGFTMYSIGIVKDVYLVWIPWAGLVDTVVQTFYTGSFPTQALQAGQHSPFSVSVKLFTYNPMATTSIDNVVVELLPSWLNNQPAFKTSVSIPAGYGEISVGPFNATADQIQLWWPSGLGSQPLYNISVSLTNPSSQTSLVDTRQIGFRVASMVTGNDTDPEYVEKNMNTDGSDSFGLMWRINGQAIFNRGANVIPMDNLDGRFDDVAHRQMVLSARDGNMNTLRVWGGGLYLPQVFYDTCDEVGVLVLHDLMNRQSFQGIEQEVLGYQHQVRRLAHHPAIIVWNGCNECLGLNGVVPNVVTIAANEDPSRVIWPSCPASGWATGVHRLTGLPDGNALALAASNGIEAHGPYQHGDGWPAVNGQFDSLNPFNPDTPPQEYPSGYVGLGQPNQFTSEFGSATWSSFESVSATLNASHWSLHGGVPPDTCTGSWNNQCKGNNPMAQRNYPCDSIYASYYGQDALKELDEVGEQAFKKQLYKCLLGSSLKVKSYIEETRSRNCFGTLVWQLNEIWPTGGWGSLEYGTALAGQVVGGRWKPTHYWMRKSLFNDVLIACGVDGTLGSSLWCYVKNDSPQSVSGELQFDSIEFANASAVLPVYSAPLDLAAGPGTLKWIEVGLPSSFVPTTHMLEATFTNGDTILSYNNMLLAAPNQISGLENFTITLDVSSKPNEDQSVNITLEKSNDAIGLYVTLTTLAQGRFSDNAFLMTSLSVVVQFVPFGPLDLATLSSTLRVEHLGNYMA